MSTAALVASKPHLPFDTNAALASVDVPLLLYFAFWYLGNYYYTISNKLALNAGGGKQGFPLTISTMQVQRRRSAPKSALLPQ